MRPFDHPLSGVGGGEAALNVYPYTDGCAALFTETDYLSFTPAIAGDRKKWTFSTWVKPNDINDGVLFYAGSDYLLLSDGDGVRKLNLIFGGVNTLRADAIIKDETHYAHIVVAVDTTQAAQEDRVKMYLNGSRITGSPVTAWPALNGEGGFNSVTEHRINKRGSDSFSNSGYYADTKFIGDVALGPEHFGEWSSVVSGLWVAKRYTGAYGVNGSYPDFADAADLGKDASGNGNDWTVNGAPVQSGDVPWNNYVTFNPFTCYYPADLSNGNLTATGDGTGSRYQRGTFAIDGFNAYLEFENAGAPGASLVGLSECNDDRFGPIGAGSAYIYYHANGNIMVDGSLVETVSAWGDGDVISLAYNAETNEVQVRLNNALQGVYGVNSVKPLTPFVNARSTNSITLINGATGFTYAPPAGFKALCTASLPEPDVLDPSTGVAVVLRNGTGSDVTVSGLGFGPDSVLTKDRYNTRSWCLQDRVRGPENCLFTDLTNAEDVKPGAIPAFNADGYDLGNQSITNDLGSSYIDLCLKRGPEFGFDIVSGINHTSGNPTPFDHALGDSVEFGFVRRLDDVDHWWLFHRDLGADKYLCLNLTQAATTSAGFWVVNTSTQFCVPSSLGTGSYVAYLFRSVPGFSKVFSHIGNGSTDGPWDDFGFTPLIVLAKSADAVQPWHLYDTVRNPYNDPYINQLLYPSSDRDEWTLGMFMAHSNGIKNGSTSTRMNGSGQLTVGIAWAAQPFKYSNAF
ncbi:DUF7483 domain-containing protein [Salidesulfovibrio brasiliensis]|uniref:DUF7483 domain-containing protein n=1 Tax=Salidesulfovibrio brasiliensis TaxID=221711 RepID=UPI0006D1857B|nr:LamG-like jellyroll fold domain-containing protein [Salidesulfovibrio brasiliensis]